MNSNDPNDDFHATADDRGPRRGNGSGARKNGGKAGGAKKAPKPATAGTWFLRGLAWAGGLLAAGLLTMACVIGVAMAMAYPNLPDISELSDYKPKLPLRIYSAEGSLLGEFGEERRRLVPINEIPKVMKDAVLAIEDARFYSHGGVDYIGVVRAAVSNLGGSINQGASTITMQVARNVYLSSERTYTRKIYEILLTFKLEHLLSKDQILEIYMNQIFLGHRSYGFAAASETYFGKPLKDITIAEAAMLAGLPKAPSANNPFNNFKRATQRQLYIIDRMVDAGFITREQGQAAKQERVYLRRGPNAAPSTAGNVDDSGNSRSVHAEFATEMVRQLVYAKYGAETYTRGINVYTTIKAADQNAAYTALRNGLQDYEKRQFYRGPEGFIDLPSNAAALDDAIDQALDDHPDNGDVRAAVVLAADARRVTVENSNGERIDITGDGLKPVQSGLAANAPPKLKIRPGAIVRISPNNKGGWDLTQLPEVEGAFVALDPSTGAVISLVGGFDFNKNKFNHVTQAWRQPGSSFKPFIYSAALEKGITPMTVLNDAPLFFGSSVTGGQAWAPKNYEGSFDGPMTARRALAKSRNIPTVLTLQHIGPTYAQQWITRFGFEAAKHPAYLTMALGAGSVTPMQMATAYEVFANGGYRVNPYLITKVTDQRGQVLAETVPKPLDESMRVISARNAFIMQSMLQEVARSGTAARTQALLKRPDIYGKTGTTNDSLDAWFVGFQPTLVAATWIGYDNPRKLGSRETGGGLALPIWVDYMQTALKGVPVREYTPPSGVTYVNGDWAFDEYAWDGGVKTLGMTEGPLIQDNTGTTGNEGIPTQPLPPADERNRILDLFRN
ncbi:MAG: Penicillin-binding protein 1A [Paracidovorax wautersii]|uniref:Penicillin-binding protein 1A n=1 Tax=Paracidovorax wautersii TaxID=1177982 RepID=A0A7V8JRJ2_9BURK|nr:MAG: Penicillin-binding protein 1A [Paracidovorax wautersii]